MKGSAGWLVLMTFGAVGPLLAAEKTPVEQVTAFEMHLQDVLNSEEYARDPKAVLKYFDPGEKTRFFDVMTPVEFRGDEFRKHFSEVSNNFHGKLQFLELEVHADNSIGFANYIQHYVGKDQTGTTFDMMVRTTDCLVKRDGEWLIVAEHMSLALDPKVMASAFAKPKP